MRKIAFLSNLVRRSSPFTFACSLLLGSGCAPDASSSAPESPAEPSPASALREQSPEQAGRVLGQPESFVASQGGFELTRGSDGASRMLAVALPADGFSGSGYTTNAWLYNPATNIWTTTGFMTVGRFLHTATRLADGKVLVTGGRFGSSQYTNTAEVYNPATATWTTVGSMATAREDHSAVLLANGKVLVAGGTNTSGTVSSAELFDPVTGSWSPAGTTAARTVPTLTLLGNGGMSSSREATRRAPPARSTTRLGVYDVGARLLAGVLGRWGKAFADSHAVMVADIESRFGVDALAQKDAR